MIYLITGEPGDGKTNLAVTMIKELAEKEKRPVFCHNIEILDAVALPWTEIDPLKWFECPVGSIIFLDECQDHFRPRMRGVVPEFAAKLEKHRHGGTDIYLCTQHPSFIDSHERKLVAKHFYVRRKLGTRMKSVYTFKGCRDNPEKTFKTGALSEVLVSDNIEAFKWYKSTELNTQKRSIPWKLWVLILLAIGLPVFAWWFYHRLASKGADPVLSSSALAASGVASDGGRHTAGPLSAADYVAQFNPRIPGLAYTAPVYDSVTAPTEAPYPAACLRSAAQSRCACYTQQGTALDMPQELCLQIVERGFFVSWRAAKAAPLPVVPLEAPKLTAARVEP